jgi:hypothetical protein
MLLLLMVRTNSMNLTSKGMVLITNDFTNILVDDYGNITLIRNPLHPHLMKKSSFQINPFCHMPPKIFFVYFMIFFLFLRSKILGYQNFITLQIDKVIR